MSFNLFKNNCAVLNEYLKPTSFESISFYDEIWVSNGIDPRWLFEPTQHFQNRYTFDWLSCASRLSARARSFLSAFFSHFA